VAPFLLNFIKITLNVILVVAVIGILGVPMTSVITVIASAGVAIGLALQGALSNLAGGLMILIFKPFKIGNYVLVNGLEGTVKDIGIFYTVLDTIDNCEITIPNGTVMGSPIKNFSSHDRRRVDMDIQVAYGSDVKRVNEILLEEISKHELAILDPAPFARLTNMQDSALVFTIRVWCKTEDYWPFKFDLNERIVNRLNAEGVVIPFNQLDVHIKKED
ncbi:MAG: mechanosensitive ion channel family protein, partial [Clostridia bacterium]|nr:mechanosensitive ion channel family protein [Clostridia bacterium]